MTNLFEENAYIKEIKTKIKSLDMENNAVELENTVFYGKSGGQPGDIGQIIIDGRKIEVKDTLKDKNSIINILEDIGGIIIGQTVIARIDWRRRYKYMRMHSALHLMCATIPLGVTGGQIGYEKSRLDFNDPDKQINKEELEIKINNLLSKDNEITYEYIDSKILDNKPELVRTMSVKPPKIDGKLRFVKIGTIDFQPCGGTHVKSTNEIGPIKIGKIENKGKMNRRVNILLND
ncbi:MAG: alanyl-tRNA editing protein [Pelagibacteraceae bacterium]|jgi:misacylated tRNA(Ala) deacylase|nr:alanyl-tRNA editing protein [Pelagibacteraceae bacterium]MBT6353537.1 alanyl-tRNA editing protein [Pelagibacteraceae bacterium]